MCAQVGDILSIIDKPSAQESSWWRAKKEFEVSFILPYSLVIVIRTLYNTSSGKQLIRVWSPAS